MMSDDDFSPHVLLPSMDFAQVSCWLALRAAMTTATRSRSGFWWRAHEPGRLPHLASTSASGSCRPPCSWPEQCCGFGFMRQASGVVKGDVLCLLSQLEVR